MFAPSGPEPIVAIKAGKCKVEPHRDEAKRAAGKLWITPQKDRGEVIVVKKDDVNHFQWRSRETLDVDLSDLEEHCSSDAALSSFTQDVQSNSRRYISLFAESADELMPERSYGVVEEDSDETDEEDLKV